MEFDFGSSLREEIVKKKNIHLDNRHYLALNLFCINRIVCAWEVLRVFFHFNPYQFLCSYEIPPMHFQRQGPWATHHMHPKALQLLQIQLQEDRGRRTIKKSSRMFSIEASQLVNGRK